MALGEWGRGKAMGTTKPVTAIVVTLFALFFLAQLQPLLAQAATRGQSHGHTHPLEQVR